MLSGCQALEGCGNKYQCVRYHHFLNSTPYSCFNAHQMCRVSKFVKNDYPYFVPTPEVAMEKLVQLSEEFGLYEWEKSE
jgi:hypothetical protein